MSKCKRQLQEAMSIPFQMPRLGDPQRYVGLYVIHFPHGVSVGYTREEVAILLAEPQYRDVSAYRIHRCDDAGCIELAGVTPRDFVGDEWMIFASRDDDDAARDFARIRQCALSTPAPCPVRAELIDLANLDPPHAVCLVYARSASTMVSSWLLAIGFRGGDRVFGGQEAAELRNAATTDPIASAALPAASQYASRTRQQLLARVSEPLQR